MISKGNHVKFLSFVLLATSEEAKIFFFGSMYNKTIFWFGFCDIQKNQGLGKGYQFQQINLTETLIILDITKTPSNNCLLSVI